MSLSLPKALRPWSESLHALVPDLAIALGPLLLGLSRALGPFASVSSAGREEPDGLSGLSRRGPYDRLLSSELALLDIDPDEFLRRASSSEHLFFDLQRQSPREGRRCVALFDAGPDQLGEPRLAHLALLLVLERRASEAGAELCWQILQRPGHVVNTADRAGIRALLSGRSGDLPSAASLQACLEATPLRGGDELWVIGGKRAAALAGHRAGRLSIEASRSGGGAGRDALLVEVSSQGRQRISLSLPLPPLEVRAALIREPLRVEHPDAIVPPSRGKSVSALMPFLAFSPEGSRLVCREQSGTLLAFPVPSLHRRPARLDLAARDQVIAAGWSHHKLGAVLRRGDKTVLLQPPDSRTLRDADLEPEIPASIAPMCIVNDPARSTLVAHFVVGGRHWQWPLEELPMSVAGPTLALTRRDGVIIEGHDSIHEYLLPNVGRCDRIWFGPGQLCAVHLPSDDSWALVDPSISKAVRMWRISGEVVGATYGRPDRSLAVLVSEGKPGPLLLRYVDGSETRLTDYALAAAASSGSRPLVAFIHAGEHQSLILYDPIDHRTLSIREIAS